MRTITLHCKEKNSDVHYKTEMQILTQFEMHGYTWAVHLADLSGNEGLTDSDFDLQCSEVTTGARIPLQFHYTDISECAAEAKDFLEFRGKTLTDQKYNEMKEYISQHHFEISNPVK